MKFLLIFIICALSLFQAKNQLKNKIKNRESPSIATIREKYFGQKRFFLNTSDYEQYPFEYEITNPLSIEEQEILNPRKIKSNAPEAYNMREPNASTLKDNDILLVKNTDALRKFPKFDKLALDDAKEIRPKKYSKDPLPYYNNGINFTKLIVSRDENLWSVPIKVETEDDTNQYDFRSDKLYQQRKKLLLRKPTNTYYDPTYIPYLQRLDPLNRTLLQATADKLIPKSVEFNKFLKETRIKELAFDRVLGKLKESDYDDLQREPERDYEKIKQFENRQTRDALMDEPRKTIKKNDPEPYMHGGEGIKSSAKRHKHEASTLGEESRENRKVSHSRK